VVIRNVQKIFQSVKERWHNCFHARTAKLRINGPIWNQGIISIHAGEQRSIEGSIKTSLQSTRIDWKSVFDRVNEELSWLQERDITPTLRTLFYRLHQVMIL
jgi:hypothetical protein